MNLAEALIRIINELKSPHLAAAIVLAFLQLTIVLTLFREAIHLAGESMGIGSLPVYGSLMVLAYSLSVLEISAGSWMVSAIAKIFEKRKLYIAKEKEKCDLRKKNASRMMAFLEHAPPESIQILKSLVESSRKEFSRSEALRSLQRIGAIEELVETRNNYSVYQLTPEWGPVISSHFETLRNEYLDREVQRLSEDEVAFLRLFSELTTSFEDPEQTSLLPFKTYLGGRSLEHKGLIFRMENARLPDHEDWKVPSDAKAKIENCCELVLGRDLIQLDLNRVAASGASGSGMRSS